jgi:hypothetical protein
MLKKIISIFLCFLIAITSYTRVAYAEDVVIPYIPPITVPATETDVGSAVSPMKKDDRAPYTGVLLSPRAIATILSQFRNQKDQTKIEVDHAVSVERAQQEYKISELKTTSESEKKILEAQLAARKKEIVVLDERLKKEESSRANVPLWTGIGVGGGVVLTVLTVFAISSASK